MIKSIIFDLDGVLYQNKEMHYEVLNEAIREIAGENWVITKRDHISNFDALPTSKKLDILVARGLPNEYKKYISELKQKLTKQRITTIKTDDDLCKLLQNLKQDGMKLFVASNSVYDTIVGILTQLGIIQYFDKIYCNTDVVNPKPNPEMYQKVMYENKLIPVETLIVEDSPIGVQAATDSGAFVCVVTGPKDITYARLKQEMKERRQRRYKVQNLNVVIPMAGEGSRFKTAGYKQPKPLIDIYGSPMIKWVYDSINIDANFIFIVRKDQYEQYNLESILKLIAPGCTIIQVSDLTEGAACTVLLSRELIDSDKHLLIVNSDQYPVWSNSDDIFRMIYSGVDGNIPVFNSDHPKWSFVRCDKDGYIIEVKEKEVISNDATVGIYHWARGSDFVKYADRMISKNIRVNNEFYVAPVYTQAIQDGLKFKPIKVQEMWGLGTPPDLQYFLDNYKLSR